MTTFTCNDLIKTSVIVLILVSSFIEDTFFSFFASYFLYTTLSCIFSCVIFFRLFRLSVLCPLTINTAGVTFLILVVFYFFNAFVLRQSFNGKHIQFIVYALWLLAISFAVINKIVTGTHIKRAIYIGATIISITCVLQSIRLVSSNNPYFDVTGLGINPNITGEVLALFFPIIYWDTLCTRSTRNRILCRVLCSCVFVSIVLLKSRTGLVGVLSALVLCSIWMVFKTNKMNQHKRVFGYSFVLLAIIVFLLGSLGYSKSNSSRGRLFIWKISSQYILANPFWGSGLGRFDHDYNLQQAAYFNKETYSIAEKENARYVSTAYNEIFQNAFEGGLFALIISGIFFLQIAYSFKLHLGNKNTNQESNNLIPYIIGSCLFAVMSLVNFTFDAIPSMTIVLLYLGISATSNIDSYSLVRSISQSIKKGTQSLNGQAARILLFLLMFVSASIAYLQLSAGLKYEKYKAAKELLKENNFIEAMAGMIPLKKDLYNYPFYQQDIGLICLKAKQTKAAYDAFLIASNYLSDPMLYILLGRCCIDLNLLDMAEGYFKTARNIQPSLLSPYYELSRLYFLKKDTTAAFANAQYVVQRTAIGNSKNASFFKAECKKKINSLNPRQLLKTNTP